MITIKDFMETVNYKITEGSGYGWRCYGSNTHSLDSWDGDNDEGFSAGIIFDTKTQVVYEASVFDYKNGRAYRLLNPDFAQAYRDEAADRNIDTNEATDEIQYIDLENDSDFLKKARAIINYEPYDTRITIPLDLPDEELLKYMIMAHEQDMKFNDFVEMAIKSLIEDYNLENVI